MRPIALTIRAISGQFIINQGNDFDGTENFSIETHRGSSLIVVGAGAEKTGPHQCGRQNFLQKGYSLSHRVSRRPEISKNSMFLSCFAGVFFVICFDFYLNKFGATVDFQSDVEIDRDSHAVFSPRKLKPKAVPKLIQNGSPENLKIDPERWARNCARKSARKSVRKSARNLPENFRKQN